MKKLMSLLVLMTAIGINADAEHLTILTANDTHSAVMPNKSGKGGLMRWRVVMDSVRRADDNVLAVHAGDAVQGTVFFSLFRGDVEYAAIDSLGFDVFTPGNHEFDNGVNELAAHLRHVKAAKLSANYDVSGTALDGVLQPYVIKHVGGKRIAFMGINLNPKGMIADKSFVGIRYIDAETVALQLSDYLKQTGIADYVVMVSHIGHVGSPGTLNDVEIVRKSHNIDLVIGGHSHTLVDPTNSHPRSPHLVKNADGRTIAICQSGSKGEVMGKIDFDTETGKAVFSHIIIDSRLDSSIAQYTAMNKWLAPYAEQVDKKMNTRIATSEQEMTSKDQRLGNWVCDAVVEVGRQLYGKDVQFSLMNRGGIRQNMPKGDVTEGDIESMLPFDNRLVVIRIKGEYLLRVFAALGVRGGDAASRAVKVVYHRNGTVRSAKINGKNVNPNEYYTLITIDYLANGGSRMGDLKYGERLFEDSEPYGKHVLEYVKQLDAQGKTIKSSNEKRMYFEAN